MADFCFLNRAVVIWQKCYLAVIIAFFNVNLSNNTVCTHLVCVISYFFVSKTLLYLQPAAILKLPQYEVSILDLTHNPHYAIVRYSDCRKQIPIYYLSKKVTLNPEG
ncbi:MAG: hypothetical protein BA865_10265 [Desulfobacterales bacterium S5133MH4]|nr:MAG: hypothetical protein BA865_10265 [Desulfobacterales bacterium S5133MH4]